jgi:hypothetical protein
MNGGGILSLLNLK